MAPCKPLWRHLLARIAAGEAPIEVVWARARQGSHDRGGRARAGTGLHQASQGVDREAQIRSLSAVRARRPDYQHDLSLHVLAEAAGELAQRGAGDLLVELRQF